MSWLFIDSARLGEMRVGWLESGKNEMWDAKGRSHELLPFLYSKVLAKEKGRIFGICVVSGPGSFSAVRTGVLVANLLSRLLRKPLVGVSLSDAADLDALARRLADGSLSPVGYVKPEYDAEPNITAPKPS